MKETTLSCVKSLPENHLLFNVTFSFTKVSTFSPQKHLNHKVTKGEVKEVKKYTHLNSKLIVIVLSGQQKENFLPPAAVFAVCFTQKKTWKW